MGILGKAFGALESVGNATLKVATFGVLGQSEEERAADQARREARREAEYMADQNGEQVAWHCKYCGMMVWSNPYRAPRVDSRCPNAGNSYGHRFTK